MSVLGTGKAVLRGIYALHKAAAVKPNRVAVISRQSNAPSIDIQMLTEALRADGDLDVRVLCRTLDGGLAAKIKYALHMIGPQMHTLATSKVIVLDSYCIAASILNHKRDLTVIQMWHAMGALKKFGKSVLDQKEGSSRKLAEAMDMHRGYDVILASSETSRKYFAEAFGYGEEVFEILPLPKADLLTDPDWMAAKKEELLQKVPVLRGKKVALYAPTFRKGGDPAEQLKGMESLSAAFAQANAAAGSASTSQDGADEWVLLLSPHPLMGEVELPGTVTAPGFATMDLLAVCDHFITDYSAAVYEAVLADKPVSLYTYDLDTYLDDRGFYLDFRTDMPAVPITEAAGVVREVQHFAAAGGQDGAGSAGSARETAMARQHAFRDRYITMPEGDSCTGRLTELIREKLKSKSLATGKRR